MRSFLNSRQIGGDWESYQTPSCTDCIENDDGHIDVPTVTVTGGSSVTITVRMQNAPNNVEAMGFDISVPTGFTYTGFAKGSLLPSNYLLEVNPVSGNTFRCGAYRVGGLDVISAGSSGDIVQISFDTATDISGSQASLAALEDDISTWSATPGCVLTDDCNGDINKDGDITPQDALAAFQKYMLICPTSVGLKCEDFCADVNRDGKTTPADALCIFRKYLKQPSCLD
ncbi:MAG: dockerin type I domain-containing protein [Desulfobacterales bacterium]